MGTIIGIDVGGSTTKIVGFNPKGELIAPIFVKANDPVTSVYGAFGKFTNSNGLSLGDIDSVMVTGVGSSSIPDDIYGLRCVRVAEFDSIGLGGLYLTGLDQAVIVSMGTGTAIVYAGKKKRIEYMGGTGIGGGTLTGLSKKLYGVRTISDIVDLAKSGKLENVDLRVSDLTSKNIDGMSSEITASNFGKVSDLAGREDLALGLINMVFETVAMLSLFAARDKKLDNIILTGNLTTIPQAKEIFGEMSRLFGKNYIIPKYSNFATVIGAALSELNRIGARAGRGE
jgi:type II pantothenate kinase